MSSCSVFVASQSSKAVVFDTIIDALKYNTTPTKDAAIQQRSLDGTIIKIGKNLMLSFQNALRLSSYRAKSANGEFPSVTRIVSSPLWWWKGDTSSDHIIIDGANGIEPAADTSATSQRGRKLKVLHTIQSEIKDDAELPSIRCTSDAATVSAGSIGKWLQSLPPPGGLCLAAYNRILIVVIKLGET